MGKKYIDYYSADYSCLLLPQALLFGPQFSGLDINIS